MEKNLRVGFLTTKSGRWPDALPLERLNAYANWVKAELTNVEITIIDSIVSDTIQTRQTIDTFKKASVDLVIMLYGAFTGDDIPCMLAEELNVPLILWAPREPEFMRDDRLYANALVAVTMNAASLHRLGKKNHVLYGDKEDSRIVSQLKRMVCVYTVIRKLKGALFGLFGYRPTAFYNSAFDEGLIRRTFGVRFEETSLKTVFDRMAAIPEADCMADMDKITGCYDTSAVPKGHLENHSNLYLALKEIIKEQGYDFASLKCWPEMGALKATPCGVIGRLADDDIHVICEGDIDAGLATMTQHYFTGLPAFVADMIKIDENQNTFTFWHCGNAALSHMDPGDGIIAANHPLAGQGVAFYGVLKPGPVTIARCCNIGGTYKLFLLKGEAVPTQRITKGVMVDVRLEAPVRKVLDEMFKEGIPHHYSLVWQDIAEDMVMLADLLGMEVISCGTVL